jgi:hypothetical protein
MTSDDEDTDDIRPSSCTLDLTLGVVVAVALAILGDLAWAWASRR